MAVNNPQQTHPTYTGSSGVLKTFSSIPNAPTTFGLAATGRMFFADPFIDTQKHSRTAFRLSANYTLPFELEAFAGFGFVFNEHSNADTSRSATSFFENSDIGLKWGHEIANDFFVSAYGFGRFLSGTRIARNSSGFSRQSSGPIAQGFLGLGTTYSLQNRWENFPLRLHLNVGYRSPNSDLTPTNNASLANRESHIEVFNMDAYGYQSIVASFAAEAPYHWVTPFIDYSTEYALSTGDDPVVYEQNRHNVALGMRATPHPAVAIMAALDLGFNDDINGAGVAIPQNTPWEVYFGVSFQAIGDGLFASEGSVRGRVTDAETGLPLPDVQATMVGEITLPQVTDLSGFYQVDRIGNGNYQIRFEKQGYQSQSQNFEIRNGEPVILDIALETLGPKKGNIRAKIIDADTGDPIEKAIVQISGMDRPLATAANGESLAQGLKEGTYNMRVEANGYEPADFPVEVFPRETVDQTFALKKALPKVGNCAGVVRNKDGTGLTAVFTTEDGSIVPFGTDPLTGRFNQPLPEGQYRFKVQAENYLPKTIDCDVKAGETSQNDINLEKPEKATVIEDKIVLPDAIYFDFDSEKIQSRSFDVLDQIVNILKQNQDFGLLQIEGHTDSVGADAYNQKLSERRAQSVQKYLIQKGISAKELRAIGFGESQPVATNLTSEGRGENRRVEFNIMRSQHERSQPNTLPRPTPKATPAPTPVPAEEPTMDEAPSPAPEEQMLPEGSTPESPPAETPVIETAPAPQDFPTPDDPPKAPEELSPDSERVEPNIDDGADFTTPSVEPNDQE